ncbi:uroporphyrinogen-III synthase [Streptomyces sp. NPDC050610]|uniref:uroporphyrinogen-III synthase n=1 Tax=Streptomyces sp. NPDC050610 TaxID=3157097 RepID=UPI0034435B59
MGGSERQRPGAREGVPLDGFTVAVTAARRAEELIALLRRRGAEVVHAPAMRTVPLADDTELRDATRQLIERAPDSVIVTTAVGFRGWLEAAEGWGLGGALLERLGGAELLARGPKVCGAVRAAGLREDFSPASESMEGVLDRLLARGVAGRRVAVQLHGAPLPDFTEKLRAAGADVVAVPVYRWLPPEDTGPLDRLLDAVLARTVDAVTFTSAPAVAGLFDRAERRGVGAELSAAFRAEVLVACVGPVTAQPLAEREVPVVHPERFRLGPLVQLVCDELPCRVSELEASGRRLAVLGRAVLVDGVARPVPPGGMSLLRALARRPGRVVPPGELLAALPDADGRNHDGSAVEAAVDGLRTSLDVPELIQTVGEDGYRLAVEEGRA